MSGWYKAGASRCVVVHFGSAAMAMNRSTGLLAALLLSLWCCEIGNVGFAEAVLFGVWRPRFLNNPPDIPAIIDDAQDSGVNSIEELDSQTRVEVVTRRIVGGTQFVQEEPICRRSSLGILGGCSPQLLYLTAEFGVPIIGRLFAPAITPEKLTREFLEGMPSPGPVCCHFAQEFQSNFCACDPNVILTFRNQGFFDPLQTVPFADYLYGEQCGATTFLAEDCPNGSPFDKIGNGRRLLTKG